MEPPLRRKNSFSVSHTVSERGKRGLWPTVDGIIVASKQRISTGNIYSVNCLNEVQNRNESDIKTLGEKIVRRPDEENQLPKALPGAAFPKTRGGRAAYWQLARASCRCASPRFGLVVYLCGGGRPAKILVRGPGFPARAVFVFWIF